MTFITFLMAFGLVGAALLVGVIVGTLGIKQSVSDAGLWLGAMLLMGLIAAINLVFAPIIEPLWVQFAALAALPLLTGFTTMTLVIRGNRRGVQPR